MAARAQTLFSFLGTLRSQEFTFGDPESLMTLTSLFPDMAENNPFLSYKIGDATCIFQVRQGNLRKLMLSFAQALKSIWPIAVLVCSLCDSVSCSVIPTLWSHGPPGSSVQEILQARILEWTAISSAGDTPDPGIELVSLHCRQMLYHLNHQISY